MTLGTDGSAFPGNLGRFGDIVALFEAASSRRWSYRELAAITEKGTELLALPVKKLVFLFGAHDAETVFCSLSILAAGHALFLCPGKPDDPSALELVARYRPELLLWRGEAMPAALAETCPRDGAFSGFNIFSRKGEESPVHPDIALLLATSGSIGRPKLVKLSLASMLSNSRQIIAALGIGDADRVMVNLPLSHLSGLSALITHLACGASAIIERRSVLERSFWDAFAKLGATTLPGVPFTYKMLKEMRVDELPLPGLRKMTFAAGKLPDDTWQWLCRAFLPRGVQLFSMYGQTEAGRISILEPGLILEKQGSVGKALPPTRVEFTSEGEIICHGPGAMLGYSKSRQDLSTGDQMHGTIHTGDLGRADSDGFLYITGRMSRFCKIVGERIDLGDIEQYFENTATVAAISDDERIVIFYEAGPDAAVAAQAGQLAQQLRIPRHHIVLEKIAALPRSGSGKISYGSLLESRSRAG